MIRTGIPLKADRSLTFQVVSCTVAKPYEVRWKVLNQGSEAERRNMVRGQIVGSTRAKKRVEHSIF